MQSLVTKIQIHILIIVHRIFYRNSIREFNKSGDEIAMINAEYHKRMSKLLKKKEALMTNKEKDFLLNQIIDQLAS